MCPWLWMDSPELFPISHSNSLLLIFHKNKIKILIQFDLPLLGENNKIHSFLICTILQHHCQLHFFFFWQYGGFEFRALSLLLTLPVESLCQPCFELGIFEIGYCKLLAWNWLQTVVFLISASWVARIIGVSHGVWLNCILISTIKSNWLRQAYIQ
jgi:hypothetical protein